MFRATNALAFKGVHLLGSQSVDDRLIVHGLIVTFTLRKSARKVLDLSQGWSASAMIFIPNLSVSGKSFYVSGARAEARCPKQSHRRYKRN
jgi:hypothetical protein